MIHSLQKIFNPDFLLQHAMPFNAPRLPFLYIYEFVAVAI